MDPLTAALYGLGAGTAKSILFDAPAAQRQNMLTAAAIKYSPWTHYKWDGKTADPTGNIGGNALAGAGAGLQYGLLNKAIAGGNPVSTALGNPNSGLTGAPPSPLGLDYQGLRNSYQMDPYSFGGT